MFALVCLSRWSFFVDYLSLQISGERAIDYLNTRPRLYVLDGFAGWDPEFRYKRLGQQREYVFPRLRMSAHTKSSKHCCNFIVSICFLVRACNDQGRLNQEAF